MEIANVEPNYVCNENVTKCHKKCYGNVTNVSYLILRLYMEMRDVRRRRAERKYVTKIGAQL